MKEDGVARCGGNVPDAIFVIPAKAGIYWPCAGAKARTSRQWIPACAGMTNAEGIAPHGKPPC